MRICILCQGELDLMKKISIVIPCYNEEENIFLLYQVLTDLMEQELSGYQYEILFVDNKSQDASRSLIRELCNKDKRVKAIFNRVNCGPNTNCFLVLGNRMETAPYYYMQIFRNQSK